MAFAARNSILHLSLIEGIGPATIDQIIRRLPDNLSLDAVHDLSSSDLISFFGLSERIAHKIVTGLQCTRALDREYALIEKYAISWATVLDAEYPAELRTIDAPPALIYWRGNLADTQQSIAIVGARKAHTYAQRAIDGLVPTLVDAGWTIVSGGALGADTMAHQAALNAQGRTVAIIGSGLLSPYPSANKKLFEDIIASGGALMSIFGLNAPAAPGNFFARNRIISGMSRGCIVVQAAEKSGTKITARCALDQGKEVFAVPGPVDDELSAGCHYLIQQGAKLITCAKDVLIEFGQQAHAKAELQQQMNMFASPHEAAILAACREPQSVDDLVASLALPLSELHSLLFDLQIAGKLRQDFTGMWVSK